MGADLSFLDGSGIDQKTGLDYTGGEDKYLSALQRFYNSYGKNRTKVEDFFAAKDYESFMITVHALKSNSKMIGALSLSKAFEELETAARNNETDVIESKTAPALSEYQKLIEILKPISEMGDLKAPSEISADEAKSVAEKLLEALDDFDDELSKELVVKLSGYPFRLTARDKLKEAEKYIDDFMYDEAAELIKEISPTIE